MKTAHKHNQEKIHYDFNGETTQTGPINTIKQIHLFNVFLTFANPHPAGHALVAEITTSAAIEIIRTWPESSANLRRLENLKTGEIKLEPEGINSEPSFRRLIFAQRDNQKLRFHSIDTRLWARCGGLP